MSELSEKSRQMNETARWLGLPLSVRVCPGCGREVVFHEDEDDNAHIREGCPTKEQEK